MPGNTASGTAPGTSSTSRAGAGVDGGATTSPSTSSKGSAKTARANVAPAPTTPGSTTTSRTTSAMSGSGDVTPASASRLRKQAISSPNGSISGQRASIGKPSNLTNASKPTKSTNLKSSSTLHTLQLSPSAHPRTDPLAALTALRKLLLSLVSSTSGSAFSSRSGGCTAYKMTKEEHALAVHLVGVVDPFVYRGVRASGGVGLTGTSAGASNAGAGAGAANSGSGFGTTDNAMAVVLRKPTFLSITDTPTEIIDYILSFVEAKSDLLSLALSSKRLYDLVFPRHWEYRVIRCKVSDKDVWKHLCGDRSLARNVRVLEILDERVGTTAVGGPSTSGKAGQQQKIAASTRLVPRTLCKPTSSTSSDLQASSSEDELDIHKKHERRLSSALLRMTGLTELRWACIHSPVSMARVWNAISVRAKGLRVLEVTDNLMFGPLVFGDGASEDESQTGSSSEGSGGEDEEEEDGLGRTRRPLLSMETAIFRSTSHSYGASKTPDISRIGSMTAQCPNLKTLEITYIPPRTSLPSSHHGQIQPHLTNPNARPRPLLDAFLLSSLVPSSLLPSLPNNISPYAQPARWPSLTRLTLTNLRCSSPGTLSAFLSAHICVEVLELVDLVLYVPAGGGGGGGALGAIANGSGTSMLTLQTGALPRLREVNAARDIITAIMECPLVQHHEKYEQGNVEDDHANVEDNDDDDQNKNDDEVDVQNIPVKVTARNLPQRPLETIKGFKLSGNPHQHSQSHPNAHRPRNPDDRFLVALRSVGTPVRRVEMAGWHDMDEVRRVVACVPRVTWLDVGKRIGGGGVNGGLSGVNISGWGNEIGRDWERGRRGELRKASARERLKGREDMTNGAPSHMLEWTDLLATLPDLATMHGVKFFYEVSSPSAAGVDSTVSSSHHDTSISMTDSAPSNSTSLNTTAASALSSTTRSRLRKNDEIASVLAWKCPKLRRVDHWEGAVGLCGKVVILLRDGGSSGGTSGDSVKAKDGSQKGKGKERDDLKGKAKERERESVRWEVRRVKI